MRHIRARTTSLLPGEPAYRAPRGSKRIAQPKLENPRIARAGNPPEEGGTVRPGGVAEVHAVERIEELRPEFDLVCLRIRHREVLEQRQIQIHRRGSDQSVTPQLAECAQSIRREGGGVEPLQDPVST